MSTSEPYSINCRCELPTCWSPYCQEACAARARRLCFRNVIITGEPEIGEGVSIGDYSEVNARDARVVIGKGCDIASFVAINAADSSDRCLGRAKEIKRQDITIGERVFIGSHCFIGGGVTIGHHSKVAAGTIIRKATTIPPYSLVAMGLTQNITPGHEQVPVVGPRVFYGVYAPR